MNFLTHSSSWPRRRRDQLQLRGGFARAAFLSRAVAGGAAAACATRRLARSDTRSRPRVRLRGCLRRRFADDDRHVREALALEVRAALSARIQALGEPAARTAVDGNPRDVQLVGVHVVVVAGVGDGAAHAASRSARRRTRRRTAAAPALRARSCRESRRRRGAACAAPCARTCRCATACGRAACGHVIHRRFVAAVPAEVARRRELAELVPDHVLGDVDRDVRLAVVHADRVADHRRHDRRSAAPGLDDALLARLVHLLDLLRRDGPRRTGPFLSDVPLLGPSAYGRSSWWCACCGASFCPSSSGPTAWSADGPRSSALHRRRADDRPGSSRCREPTGACRDGAMRPALPMTWFSCSMLPS